MHISQSNSGNGHNFSLSLAHGKTFLLILKHYQAYLVNFQILNSVLERGFVSHFACFPQWIRQYGLVFIWQDPRGQRGTTENRNGDPAKKGRMGPSGIIGILSVSVQRIKDRNGQISYL